MKILHLCLSCVYVDGYSYQENELVAQNVRDGHDVVVIASTETIGVDRQVVYVNPSEYLGTDNARVIRLPYRKIWPIKFRKKIRSYQGLYKQLVTEKPDLILFHGLCAWEILTVIKYKKNNSAVELLFDSHTDFTNSANSLVSRFFLHYLFYRSIVKLSIKHIKKVLCVSVSVMEFARDFYGIPEDKIEFFPLGGKIFDDAEYEVIRRKVRKELGVLDHDLVFIQTGKINSSKKIIESLISFSTIRDCKLNSHFFIVGHLFEDVKHKVQNFIAKDPRIKFLGWRDPTELRGLLAAADVYVQPGTQSATMQMSLCCRCLVVLDDVSSHVPFVTTNGWLVHTQEDLAFAFNCISKEAEEGLLGTRVCQSAKIAGDLLSYEKLAARLYQ
ncbi:glycosyltransferase family 4 protein [Alcaligenaceae bacterium]|nr:glycosyltransferase family 4 protein [Alcaligenaceae bacterium]